MQNRWYNPPVEQDRAMVLAEIDAKRPVRVASNDNIGFDVCGNRYIAYLTRLTNTPLDIPSTNI